MLGTMQKMDCCIKSASPFYLSYFFLYTFSLFVPARLNNSNTLFTDYKNPTSFDGSINKCSTGMQ